MSERDGAIAIRCPGDISKMGVVFEAVEGKKRSRFSVLSLLI